MNKIKNRNLYILLVLGVVLLGILGVVSSYYFQKLSIEHDALYHVPDYEARLNQYVNNESKKISSYLELIKEKKELQTIFKNGNRQKLYEKALPIFKHLNENSDITHFYFIKPDGKVLLRVHDEFRFSDIVNRYTFLQSKKKLAPFYGLEFGLKKNYTLRVVNPWIVDGELIGFVELGKEVDKVIDSLSKQLHFEIYFAVNKSVFKNAPQFVQQRLDKTYKTDRQYIVYKTNKVPENINTIINGNNRFYWVKIDDQVFISYKNDLKDVSGRNLGKILYLVNITTQYSEFITTILRYSMIMVAGTLLMLLIGFFFAKTSQNKINVTLENLEKQKQKAEDLFDEQKHLLSLFDKGDSVLFKWNNNDQWSINYVSNNVSKLLGYSKVDFLDKKVVYASCIHKDDIAHVTQEVENAIKHNLDFFKHDPYRIVTKTGEIRWVIDYTVTQKDKDNSIQYFIGYITDITQQKQKDDKLKQKLQKFINAQNSIVILTDGKNIQFVNKTFLDFFGYNTLDDFQKNYNCICDRFVRQESFFHLKKVKKDETNWIQSLLNLSGRARVVSMVSSDSTPHAFSVSINRYENDSYVVNFSDISDTMIEKLELAREATIDELTGLFNRAYFHKYIDSILNLHKDQKMNTGIIFFDIDHFKKVNDTYGHDIGDYVLSKIANLLKKHTRADDKIVRWGGEEFIIITAIEKVKSICQMAEHLRKVIDNYKFRDINSVTCSFGCSIYNENTNILDTIKIADEKLYIAKNSGRNRVECTYV